MYPDLHVVHTALWSHWTQLSGHFYSHVLVNGLILKLFLLGQSATHSWLWDTPVEHIHYLLFLTESSGQLRQLSYEGPSQVLQDGWHSSTWI